jgi:uncharacterized SAM-binding protein YcdF (DUF218 family)
VTTSVWERLIRLLGASIVVVFLAVAFTPLSNVVAGRLAITENLKSANPADAIVVLGGGLLRNGVLNQESLRRTVRGIELYKQGVAPLLVLLGPSRLDETEPTEAEVRAKLARAVGIPTDAIIKLETANTTAEESRQSAVLLRPRNVRRIILVTESMHMRRAQSVFERAGFEALPAISTDYVAIMRAPQDRLWLAMRFLQETTALFYYRLAGYI